MTYLLGIDPGKKGALALLDPETFDLNIMDMPVLPKKSGKGVDTNYSELAHIMDPPQGTRVFAVIENVWSMPREGVSSAHAFGRNNGALLMGLACWEIPYRPITPSQWKKHFGLSSNKGASRMLATERFPRNAREFARVKDDGRAEAALLALYGLEKNLFSQTP